MSYLIDDKIVDALANMLSSYSQGNTQVSFSHAQVMVKAIIVGGYENLSGRPFKKRKIASTPNLINNNLTSILQANYDERNNTQNNIQNNIPPIPRSRPDLTVDTEMSLLDAPTKVWTPQGAMLLPTTLPEAISAFPPLFPSHK